MIFSLVLPPLLIIFALAVLLYLFFRKFPEVERKVRERSGNSPVSFLSVSDRLKRFFLGIVERFARSFNLLSLKTHHWLSLLVAKVRAARLRAAERISEQKKARDLKREPPLFQPRTNAEKTESPDMLHRPDISKETPNEPNEVFPAVSSATSETESDRISRLRQWFGKKPDESPSRLGASQEKPLRHEDTRLPASLSQEDQEENLPPLVSEPLQPAPREWMETNVQKRAADISRKFGDAVRRLRPERKPAIFPASAREPIIPQKKEQFEDILVDRISMNPRDIEAYERLGDYYLEQNNLVDAKECYRQVLKLSPAYRLVKIKIRRLERLLEKERTP